MQQRYLSTWFADTILLHRCWVQVQQLKRYQQPFHPISSCLRRRRAKGTLELQGSWVGGFLGVMTCEFLPLKNTYLELYWYGRVMLKLVWYHPGSIRDVLLERILMAGGRIFAAPGTYNPIIHQNCSHQAQDPMTLCRRENCFFQMNVFNSVGQLATNVTWSTCRHSAGKKRGCIPNSLAKNIPTE